jgi:hypothetical protein
MYFPRWLLDQGIGVDNNGLSILDLVDSGTIDCKLAGLLWILMEGRASVLVAAGPSFAGKTTLLHALLDFLPPGLQRVSLKGDYEDFKFTENSPPEKTYMIAEEISNHGFFEDYLWGYKAIRAFKLLSEGYALGATIHARNSQEVLYVLYKHLGIPLPELARLGIVVNLHAVNGRTYYDDPIRRVSSVDLILTTPEGLAIQVLAARKYTEKGFDYQSEKTLRQALSEKRLIGEKCVYAEIDARMRLLKHLLKTGNTSREEVRKAVQDFYHCRTNRSAGNKVT